MSNKISAHIGLAGLAALIGLAMAGGLSGCDEKPKAAPSGSAMLAAGYSFAPEITGVEMGGSDMFIVTGKTVANARVRFSYDQKRSIGVTSDSRGHFRAELPVGKNGGLYDVGSEDEGRLIYAEGRLYIPPGHPEKAVLLRAGSPSLPLFNDKTVVAVLDYDSAGAVAITGRTQPNTAVEVTLNDDIWRVSSDAQGLYSATMQIPPPSAQDNINNLTVDTGGTHTVRNFKDSMPKVKGADNITRFEEGWRIDWVLPGGGMQTTLVF
ncbi:MAG: hypothetical protein WBQ60_00650 [Asticcacaulis sp.]